MYLILVDTYKMMTDGFTVSKMTGSVKSNVLFALQIQVIEREATIGSASVEYHGVQPTGCKDNEPEQNRGASIKAFSQEHRPILA